MATNTYVALDKVTLSSTATTATFSSIPQGYTDLVIVANFLCSADSNPSAYVNGVNTGTLYSNTHLTGSGTAAASSRNSSSTTWQLAPGPIASETTSPETMIINLQNYSNTTTYKTALFRYGVVAATYKGVAATVGLYRDTAAITSFTLKTDQLFSVGSTFSLYGIKAEGASGTKATGGAVYSDSTYFYHVFGSTGTFTPTQSITADVFCVAGGGGAGRYAGGGGGAGGVITFIGQSLTATGYTCTVGAGGAASPSDGGTSGDGVNSSFGALTVAVGGGGGGGNSATYRAGRAGGSGGGGGGAGGTAGGATTQTGTGATNFYGYAGNGGVAYTGAGGGGAGGTSPTPVSNGNSTGNGGVGISSSFINAIGTATGTGELSSGNYYFAGGGYGFVGGSATVGTGGIGGGGGGPSKASTQAGANGVANLGGGGGTDGTGSYFGSGGSGTVIVRYAK